MGMVDELIRRQGTGPVQDNECECQVSPKYLWLLLATTRNRTAAGSMLSIAVTKRILSCCRAQRKKIKALGTLAQVSRHEVTTHRCENKYRTRTSYNVEVAAVV